MKIILSPTKKMKQDTDSFSPETVPCFLSETEIILQKLKNMTPDMLQKLWNCNDSIADQNYDRIQNMDLRSCLTPAILAYDGIAFQHMAPSVFSDEEFQYVQDHLRILSGFYGMLKPMDGVCPYRLEMQAKLCVRSAKDLYEFWGQKLYDQVRDDSGTFINLASKEYSRCIQNYLTDQDLCISCIFAEMVNGKLTQKATFAKMARGEMVRFLAEKKAEHPEVMKDFRHLGYQYRDDLSGTTEYVFQRIPK